MNLLKRIWKHRFLVSVAWSDTSSVRAKRFRTITTLSLIATIVISSVAGYWFAVSTWAKYDAEAYLSEIQSLRGETSYQDKQFQIFAQQLGTLRARLDRFDAIGETLFQDEVIGEKLDDEELRGGKGTGDIDPEDVSGITLDEMTSQLSQLSMRAIETESMLQAALNLVSDNSLSNRGHPHVWPVMHKGSWLSSKFGIRKDPFGKKAPKHHAGIDIAAGWNAPIVSSADGVVVFAGYRYGFGIMVEVRHPAGITTRYAHMNKALVKNGQQVRAGEPIGKMGSSGRSTGPHLHFEVLVNDERVNPSPFVVHDRHRMRRIAKERSAEVATIMKQ